MNSFKSTCVILVLAGVLYGVYVTLNAPPPATSGPGSQLLVDVQPPAIDFGEASKQPALHFPSLPAPGESQLGVSLPSTPPPLESGPAEIPAAYNSPDRAAPPEQPAFQPLPEQPPTDLAAPATSTSPYTLPSAPPPSSDDSPGEAASPTSSPALETYKLKRAWLAVDQHVKDGKFRDALAELSPFASNQQLSVDDRRAVLNWLDALASKVIYGPEHYLSQPYRVASRGQTLHDVAAQYKVPTQLLQNINAQSVSNPVSLLPGTELKVIPGPFRAELSLAAGELTLFVGQLYAGRFAFTMGDERPAAGTYHVLQKDQARTFVARDGRQFAAGDPANPYGNCWIDLGRNAYLHGSPATTAAGPALGCISFSPQDALDLYGILSTQSEVVIKP